MLRVRRDKEAQRQEVGALLLTALLAASLPANTAPHVGLGVVGTAIPLHAVSTRCNDERYPALAGAWVVGCNARGQIALALSLETGRLLTLPRGLDRPGLGTGALYEPGMPGGLFILTEDAIRQPDITVVREPTTAPPATDGEHLVVLGGQWIQAFKRTQASRMLIEAQPSGWQAPAVLWPTVAWAEDGEGQDLWWLNASTSPTPEPLAAGPGDQHHVVASEGWLAWVDDDDVVVLDPKSGTRKAYKAHTGFSAPPTLWQDVACWEERNQQDIDIRCSDGLTIAEEGHQQWPGRWSQWLIYRQDSKVWLYTTEAL